MKDILNPGTTTRYSCSKNIHMGWCRDFPFFLGWASPSLPLAGKKKDKSDSFSLWDPKGRRRRMEADLLGTQHVRQRLCTPVQPSSGRDQRWWRWDVDDSKVLEWDWEWENWGQRISVRIASSWRQYLIKMSKGHNSCWDCLLKGNSAPGQDRVSTAWEHEAPTSLHTCCQAFPRHLCASWGLAFACCKTSKAHYGGFISSC